MSIPGPISGQAPRNGAGNGHGHIPGRLPGHIPGPNTRVVELRVHGILGTTGSTLTDSVASVDVAGDGVGRVVRPADRLRRPVPGPALVTGERTVPRIVEGYVWSRMTSGGLMKATWAMLFPLALANVADWMLPPSRDHILGKSVNATLRALLRLAALFLTMLLVAQLTVVTLDLIAAQCLRPDSSCMAYIPEALRQITFLRSTFALLPIGLVVLLLYQLSTVSWQVLGSRQIQGNDPQGGEHTTRAPILPGANVVADPDTPALRTLHVCAGLSTPVLLALGGPFAPSADPRWILAAALVVFAVLGTAVMHDPTGLQERTGTRWWRIIVQRRTRWGLMALSTLPLVAVAVVPPPLEGTLPGSDGTIGALTFLLLLTCVLVAVLLLVAAVLAKPIWRRIPRELRPWAGGWMTAPMLMIACLLGTGFGAGLAECLRQLLGAGPLTLPRAFDDVAFVWGATAILLLVAALVIVPLLLVDRWLVDRAHHGVPAEVALLHAGRRQDQRRAASAWRRADLQRRYGHHVLLLIAAALAIGVALSTIMRSADPPGWPHWLGGVGVTLLVAVAGGLARMVYSAATKPDTARHLGVLCDLTLFWPREAHPFVPPCYALKVVPELVARAHEHLKDPDTRVVLVGHSQGSLLAAVAMARLLGSLAEADRERVGLVTAGSQLQWAYPRAFPGVIPHDSLRDLAGSLGGHWRSLCRGTDPLGGAVSTWSRQVYDGMLIGVGFRNDGTEGPLPPATRGPTGALVLGNDHWLPDPQRGPFTSRRWVPGVRAHSDYSSDPEWDRAVAMAAGLDAPVRGSTLPLRNPGLTVPPGKPTGGDGDAAPVPDEDAGIRDSSGDDSGAGEGGAGDGGAGDGGAGDRGGAGSAARPRAAELPEIIDPRGRIAPWERVLSRSPESQSD